MSILVLNIFLSVSTFAATYQFQPTAGSVEFVAIGKPAALKITGKGEGVTGQIIHEKNLLNGKLSFLLSSLKTGIGLRDEHMHKKYLKSDIHQFATFEFTNSKVLDSEVQAALKNKSEIKVDGVLTLNEVSQPTTATLVLSEYDQKLKAQASLNLKLSDYHVDIPSYAGITVAEDVSVKILFEAEQEKKK